MPLPKLTVRLSGEQAAAGDVIFGDFRDFCTKLASCLRKTERLVSASASLRYLISDLRRGSVLMTLDPIASEENEEAASDTIRLFADTIRNIENGNRIDARFTSEDLQEFRDLAKPLGSRLQFIEVAGTELTKRFVTNVDKMIAASIPSDGTVTGRLMKLNFYNRHEFTLIPPISGYVVVCSFPESMAKQVIAAVLHTVTVSGALTFKADSPFPERVQVKSIRVHPPDDELPQLEALRGILRGRIGKKTATEFIKSIRDE